MKHGDLVPKGKHAGDLFMFWGSFATFDKDLITPVGQPKLWDIK